MPAEIVLQTTPESPSLLAQRERLAAVRTMLAEREEELASLRVKLRSFEALYFRQVGVLYAELDDLEARIAEREVDLYDSDAARSRAEEARSRAQETHDAAFDASAKCEEFDPPPSLKTLFREVAKRVHPDFARDHDEQKHFTLLMARANQAYRRGDAEALQRLLDYHGETHASVFSAGSDAEFLRTARQIQHAERDIAALDAERYSLLSSDIARLHADTEAAASEHRDLLTELAAGLREQVEAAQQRFAFVDRQIRAHGR